VRRAFAVICLVLNLFVSTTSSAANTWGTDLSDFWWNPSESGWAMNASHQGEIIFATIYVYGPDSRARWYVASSMQSQGGSNTFTFVGDLYETTGPYFGLGSFNPAQVGARKVGTATFTAQSIDGATLAYSVDGTQVTKSLQRYTFRSNNLAGSYIGASRNTVSGCASGNGSYEDAAYFSVTHSSSGSVTITASFDGGASCSYSGTYTQAGKMGRIVGNLSCSNGARATFDAFEIEAGYNGFSARYTASYGGACTETGRLMAMVRD
jgi:hypothetical protein